MRYHFKNNERVGPVIYMYDLEHVNKHKKSGNHPSYLFYGNHGFLNDHKEMNAFFVAYGPAFKSNYRVKNDSIIENIDLYPLMCKILDIDPEPANNGSLARIQDILNL
uniref:Uncharacterized protein n=1 Tax=Romanomermis culicivorax TaxID=13658 RepID=A0A915I6Z2_ROMCU